MTDPTPTPAPSTGSFFTREPVLTVAALQALVTLLVSFGLPVTALQVGLLTAALTAVLALFVRTRVSPATTTPPDVATGHTERVGGS